MRDLIKKEDLYDLESLLYSHEGNKVSMNRKVALSMIEARI